MISVDVATGGFTSGVRRLRARRKNISTAAINAKPANAPRAIRSRLSRFLAVLSIS